VATSGISLGSNLYQTGSQSTASQERQSFKQLANAIQSGDLSGAQQAFTTLQKLLQTSQTGSQTSPIQSDFAALGQALSSGNLSTAQTDFSKLQTDLKAAAQSGGASGSTQGVQTAHRGGHHHHHASSASDSDTTESDSSTTSATDAVTPVGSTISVYA
jgi:hypothetical protein